MGKSCISVLGKKIDGDISSHDQLSFFVWIRVKLSLFDANIMKNNSSLLINLQRETFSIALGKCDVSISQILI